MDNELHAEQGSIFEQLREIRQQKKIKLEEIAAYTKIHLRYLEAIEGEQEGVIPDIYDALFFKSYLSSLHLEQEQEQEFLDAFIALRAERKRPTTQTTIIRRRRIEKSNRRRSGVIQTIYIVTPLLVVAIIILVMAFHSTSGEEEIPDKVEELSVEQIVNQLQPPAKPDKQTDVVTYQDSVVVRIEAQQQTWFRVVIDRQDTTEYLLQANEKVALKGDSVLNFLVGNAAGIAFNVNGKDEGVLGTENQVITGLKVTPTGIVSKRLKQIKPRETAVDTTHTE